MRSRSRRSIGRRREPGPRRGSVDVYLLPAVVGGGLGDIEEVLAAGRFLSAAGFQPLLYRDARRPLPRSVDGPWDWPPLRRIDRLRPTATNAMTVAPAWGVSAAPPTPGRWGRPGPWADEVRAIEEAYGPERTLHISLEEFGRTLTLAREGRERFREGGVRHREIGRRLHAAAVHGEAATYAREFRRFRAFDRTNVLHLFAGFRPDPAFARAFPEAVQTGPLGSGRRWARFPPGPRRWVWYASPASAERIAPAVLDGLADARPPIALEIRTPRPWRSVPPSARATLEVGADAAAGWHRRFAGAELRIVTGSRTLLEALEVGGPFLYFNGVLGTGAGTRRHRPEKIVELLRRARDLGRDPALLRDLADFARGRRVSEVVARAAARAGPWSRFPRAFVRPLYPRDRREAGAVIVRAARALARPGTKSTDVVAALRRSSVS